MVTVAWLALVPEDARPVGGHGRRRRGLAPRRGLRDGPAHPGLRPRPHPRRRHRTGMRELEHPPAVFCPPEFTVAQLRGIYEAVSGHRLDPRNFHRTQRWLPRADRGARAPSTAGRPAQLYRRGSLPHAEPTDHQGNAGLTPRDDEGPAPFGDRASSVGQFTTVHAGADRPPCLRRPPPRRRPARRPTRPSPRTHQPRAVRSHRTCLRRGGRPRPPCQPGRLWVPASLLSARSAALSAASSAATFGEALAAIGEVADRGADVADEAVDLLAEARDDVLVQAHPRGPGCSSA